MCTFSLLCVNTSNTKAASKWRQNKWNWKTTQWSYWLISHSSFLPLFQLLLFSFFLLNWIDCNLPKTKVETEVTWVSCPRSFLPPEKGDKKWHYSYPITLTGICPLPFPFSSGLGWIYFPNISCQIPNFMLKSTRNGIWKRKSSFCWRSLMFGLVF